MPLFVTSVWVANLLNVNVGISMVNKPVAISLSSIPSFTANALMVVVSLTSIDSVYTALVVVGSEPSKV